MSNTSSANKTIAQFCVKLNVTIICDILLPFLIKEIDKVLLSLVINQMKKSRRRRKVTLVIKLFFLLF